MTAFRRPLLLLTALGVLPAPLHAADGAAEPASGHNPAAAQALFEEAQRRVAAGDYEQACPKFKASYALDAAGGTLLNLADCLEKQGRTASAWSHFKDALVQAQRDGRSERMQYAQQHIRALEPKLGYLTVQVPAASNVAGLTLQVDGTELASAAWGTALPVDPGSHVVRAEAPGFEPFEQNLTLVLDELTDDVRRVAIQSVLDDLSAELVRVRGQESLDVSAAMAARIKAWRSQLAKEKAGQ